MRRFGICMDGCEKPFEDALKKVCERFKDDIIVYLEIGLGHGGTFRAVHDILSEQGVIFSMIGIDPSTNPSIRSLEHLSHTEILLQERKDVLMSRTVFMDGLDFVFIDGCHSRKCATGDFLFIEPMVVSGGLVVFHDFGVEGRNAGMQPHCNEQMDVRGAAEDLNLLPCTRPGWKFIGEWPGDRSKNGFTCGVYEKL